MTQVKVKVKSSQVKSMVRHVKRPKTNFVCLGVSLTLPPLVCCAAMSLSLAERERRAKERGAAVDKKRAAMRKQADPKSEGSAAAGGGSLFDKYAGLAGADVDEEAEVAELMEMLGASPGSQRMSARELTGRQERFLEAGWDPSPHRNPPPSLWHIKPQTREPWAIDAQFYNKGEYAIDTTDYAMPTRYGMDMDPPLSQYRIDYAEQRVSVKPGRIKPAPAWNSQPFRSVPYSLRGIKPAPGATEPWVQDHKNRKGVEDSDLLENATATELDNGGATRFLKFDAGSWDSSTTTPWRADGRHGRVRGIN